MLLMQVPLYTRSYLKCLKYQRSLYKAGVFTNAFIQPATPPGGELIRTSYIATHTEEILDKALEVMRQVGRKTGLLS